MLERVVVGHSDRSPHTIDKLQETLHECSEDITHEGAVQVHERYVVGPLTRDSIGSDQFDVHGGQFVLIALDGDSRNISQRTSHLHTDDSADHQRPHQTLDYATTTAHRTAYTTKSAA